MIPTHRLATYSLAALSCLTALACGTPREQCEDPDVCDALMDDLGLPLTHSWRTSAEFEFEGTRYTYAEVRYPAQQQVPGSLTCLLWDGSDESGRVVYWTGVFLNDLETFVHCPNGGLAERPASCAYPDGLGPIERSVEFYDFATSDSTAPGPFRACRRELWFRQTLGIWPDPRTLIP